MIGPHLRPRRGLLALGVALAFVAAACGGSSSTPGLPGGLPSIPGGLPSIPGGLPTSGGGGGGGSLTSGLSANLDKLQSYQFTETMGGASSGASASSVTISGTVINQPDKRESVNFDGTYFVVIGADSWMSSDGTTWMSAGTGASAFNAELPGALYGTWFDAYTSNYKQVGTDTQNGVACTHFQGDSTLSNMYSAIAGVKATFTADLWVATNGGYPVKGVVGFSGSAGNQSGSFGYTLDVTHVNDPSNAVPTPSVAPEPS